MLRSYFYPELRRRTRGNIKRQWFQQDGAKPHTSIKSMEELDRMFGTRIISQRNWYEWPSHSPDLNPLDYFLWPWLKSKVYQKKSYSGLAGRVQLMSEITKQIAEITQEQVRRGVLGFPNRLADCIVHHGSHFAHLRKKTSAQ